MKKTVSDKKILNIILSKLEEVEGVVFDCAYCYDVALICVLILLINSLKSHCVRVCLRAQFFLESFLIVIIVLLFVVSQNG